MSHINRYPTPARTYYVDATNGLDANRGNSEDAPWQTISKVNGFTFKPGDRILFKRGETFTGMLNPVIGGKFGSCIIYGAYGTGNRPIVDGSTSSSCLSVTSLSYMHLKYERIDFSGSDGSLSPVSLSNSNYLYFYDCIIRDAPTGRSGATIEGHHVEFDSCVSHDNLGNGFISANINNHEIRFVDCVSYSNGEADSYHGFYLGFGVLIDGCIAYDNAGTGIKLNDNSELSSGHYPVVKNCIVYNNLIGFSVTNINSTLFNNLSYGNLDANMVVIGNADNSIIIFNTFVNCLSTANRAIVFTTGVAENIIIKNNLFIQDAAIVSRANLHFDAGLGIGDYAFAFDYNTYYYSSINPTTQHIIYSSDDVGNELKDWTEWVAAGAEAHGTMLTAVPDFVTRYTDLHPEDAGNLKGLGIAIAGYEQDKDGNIRDNPPTPGCYEEEST